MSALGQKQTYAVRKAMSALPPIATAKADLCSAMGVKPVEQRKAEFFATMERINRLGVLLPKAESLDPADAAAIAEAEIILAEIRKAQAELDAMMERERKLRDFQA
jgi:hypothetical protein